MPPGRPIGGPGFLFCEGDDGRMSQFERFLGVLAWVLERVSLFVLLVGGIGTIIAMLMGVMEIVGNQIIGIAVPGARELTESVMVLIVFGALAYAQLRRRHIRVELVYVRMGPKTRAAMDVIADLAALLFFGLLLWQAYREVEFSLMFGEATDGLIRFPLWPARIVLAVGTAMLMLQLVLDLIIDITRVFTGREIENTDPSMPDIPLDKA